jgi:hypothetical protein
MERRKGGEPREGEIAEAQVEWGGGEFTSPAEVEVTALARHLLQAAARRQERAEALIEAMLPRAEVPSPVAVLQARRNAVAREALIREFGALSSVQVAELAGSQAKNRAALAHRWKEEGRIFAVSYQGTTGFPSFQFDASGRPRPVIAEIIDVLGRRSSEWELALWFIAETGWLGGRRPVDLLDRQPEAVLEAARQEAAELVF